MTNAEKAKLRELWQARIAEYRASGQSGKAWCAANQIKEHQFWYWIRKFSHHDSPRKSSPAFIPIEIQDSDNTNPSADNSLVVRIGQATIEVKPGFDSGLLRSVVQALTILC